MAVIGNTKKRKMVEALERRLERGAAKMRRKQERQARKIALAKND